MLLRNNNLANSPVKSAHLQLVVRFDVLTTTTKTIMRKITTTKNKDKQMESACIWKEKNNNKNKKISHYNNNRFRRKVQNKKNSPQRAERVLINSSDAAALMKRLVCLTTDSLLYRTPSLWRWGGIAICLPLCQLSLIRLSTYCQCGLHFNLNSKQFNGVCGLKNKI